MKLKLLTITAALVAANVNASEVAVSVSLQSLTSEVAKNVSSHEGLGLGLEHSIPVSDTASAFYGANAFVTKDILSNAGPKSATMIAGGEFSLSDSFTTQVGLSYKANSTGESDSNIHYAPGFYASAKQQLNDDFAIKLMGNQSRSSSDVESNITNDVSLGLSYSKQIEA